MSSDDEVNLVLMHEEQRQAVAAVGPPPAGLAGRGIVISLYDREFASC